MYLVTIVNNNIETVINHVSSNNNANRISGTVKQGINCINSFTFTIYPNNEGYNLILPYKTLVNVYNTKTNKYEFIGRVLKPTGSMDSNGLISKTFVCESELAYLIDSLQMYGEYHNISPRDYLRIMLDKHNQSVDKFKQFQLGNVTVTDPNDSLYKYLAYDTTWKNINEDLIDTLGGELQIRYENGVRYLDYLEEIGKVCTTEIRLGKNIQDIEEDKDPTNYYTRLVPLGNKLKTTDSEGNEVDTDERLTISSVNNGLDYIDDEGAIEEFGIIQGFATFDDVTDAKNLLTKGKNYLASQRITISDKITALDLSLIGLDIDSFEVGNYYPLKHKPLGIDYIVRIIEKSISIDNPQTSELVFGDKFEDIKDYQLNIKKMYQDASKEATGAKIKAAQVEKYAINEAYRLDGRVNEVIVGVNNEFSNVKDDINNINTFINSKNNLKIHFINTGVTGDCILIQCYNGKNILIDSNVESVANKTIEYMKSQKVSKLDYIIATHHHTDHTGGMPKILDAFDTTGAIAYHRTPNWTKMPEIETTWGTKESHDNFVSKCNEKGIKLVTPLDRNRVNISDDTYFEFYNVDYNNYDNYNGLSLCVLLVHKNMRYFFSADINHPAQELEKWNISKVDVYKTEHHCYNTAVSEEWLDKLNPSVAITTRADENVADDNATHGILQLKRIPNYVQYDVGGHIVITSTGYNFTLNTTKNYLRKKTWFNKNQTGNWYYFKSDGTVAKSQSLVINNKTYYFDDTGLCTNPNA